MTARLRCKLFGCRSAPERADDFAGAVGPDRWREDRQIGPGLSVGSELVAAARDRTDQADGIEQPIA